MPIAGHVSKPSAAMASIGNFDFPKSGFDAVVFDCDGTLVDSMPAHFDAWCEALALMARVAFSRKMFSWPWVAARRGISWWS